MEGMENFKCEGFVNPERFADGTICMNKLVVTDKAKNTVADFRLVMLVNGQVAWIDLVGKRYWLVTGNVVTDLD